MPHLILKLLKFPEESGAKVLQLLELMTLIDILEEMIEDGMHLLIKIRKEEEEKKELVINVGKKGILLENAKWEIKNDLVSIVVKMGI